MLLYDSSVHCHYMGLFFKIMTCPMQNYDINVSRMILKQYANVLYDISVLCKVMGLVFMDMVLTFYAMR